MVNKRHPGRLPLCRYCKRPGHSPEDCWFRPDAAQCRYCKMNHGEEDCVFKPEVERVSSSDASSEDDMGSRAKYQYRSAMDKLGPKIAEEPARERINELITQLRILEEARGSRAYEEDVYHGEVKPYLITEGRNKRYMGNYQRTWEEDRDLRLLRKSLSNIGNYELEQLILQAQREVEIVKQSYWMDNRALLSPPPPPRLRYSRSRSPREHRSIKELSPRGRSQRGRSPPGLTSRRRPRGLSRRRRNSRGFSPRERSPRGFSPRKSLREYSPRRSPCSRSPKAISYRSISPRGRSSRGRSPRGRSPRGRSPRAGSPRGRSPRGRSPRGRSPRGRNPRGRSPRGRSPRGRSPRGRSPRGRSPRGRSPQGRRPRDRSPRGRRPRDRSPRGRSLRDRSPRGRSSRDRSPRKTSSRDRSPREKSPRDRSLFHKRIRYSSRSRSSSSSKVSAGLVTPAYPVQDQPPENNAQMDVWGLNSRYTYTASTPQVQPNTETKTKSEKNPPKDLSEEKKKELALKRDSYSKKMEALKAELQQLQQRHVTLQNSTKEPKKSLINENFALQDTIKRQMDQFRILLQRIDFLVRLPQENKQEEQPPPPGTEVHLTPLVTVKSEEETVSLTTQSPAPLKDIPMETTATVKLGKEVVEARKEDTVGVQNTEDDNVSYECYESQCYWCSTCNVFPDKVQQYLEHLSTAAHAQRCKATGTTRPWIKKKIPLLMKQKKGKLVRIPYQGTQFLVPIKGYYCKLCEETVEDESLAIPHFESTKHNKNYKEYMSNHPGYEVDWIIQRKEAQKREKEHRFSLKPKKKMIENSETPQEKEMTVAQYLLKQRGDEIMQKLDIIRKKSEEEKNKKTDVVDLNDYGKMAEVSPSQDKKIKVNLKSLQPKRDSCAPQMLTPTPARSVIIDDDDDYELPKNQSGSIFDTEEAVILDSKMKKLKETQKRGGAVGALSRIKDLDPETEASDTGNTVSLCDIPLIREPLPKKSKPLKGRSLEKRLEESNQLSTLKGAAIDKNINKRRFQELPYLNSAAKDIADKGTRFLDKKRGNIEDDLFLLGISPEDSSVTPEIRPPPMLKK